MSENENGAHPREDTPQGTKMLVDGRPVDSPAPASVAEATKMHADELILEVAARPLGGATTFDEAERFMQAQDLDNEVRQIEHTYFMVTDNIRHDPEMDAREKAQQIAAAAKDFADRLDAVEAPPSGTGFAELQSGFKAFRDPAGAMRWLAIYTNKYRDREGEIFVDAAHKDFVNFVDRTGAYPPLRIWHVPFDVGRADQLDYTDEGFMVATGTFTKEHEHIGEALSKMDGLACSHGYRYREVDKPTGEYKAYRSFEISVLPNWAAANELTAFEIGSEIPMIGSNPQKREFFEKALGGPERVAVIDERLSDLAEYASEKEIDFKAITDVLAGGPTEEAPMDQGTKDDGARATGAAVAEPDAPATEAPAEAPAAEEPQATPAAEADPTEPGEVTTTVSDDDPSQDPEALTDPDGEKAVADATAEALKSLIGPIVATATKEAVGEAMAENSERLDHLEEAVKALAESQDAKIAERIRPRVGPSAAKSVAQSGEGRSEDDLPPEIAEQTKAVDAPQHPAEAFANDLLAIVSGGVRTG